MQQIFFISFPFGNFRGLEFDMHQNRCYKIVSENLNFQSDKPAKSGFAISYVYDNLPLNKARFPLLFNLKIPPPPIFFFSFEYSE